ncbi:hypothetical protein F5887DRAFT_969764 [Amanita rubescens]|nr:hypothetical protein F5887DRAFT_969764 [Amanita rubescens]
MTADAPTVQSSIAEVWYLKNITFGLGGNKKQYKIITQNFNGPCSLIAICNILILRGDIIILPPDRETASYEFLSQLVAEYLLVNAPGVDVSAALSVLPYTQRGMDLNPVFISPFKFNPSGDGKELQLFDQTNMKLVHGWLVDPDSTEAEAVTSVQDYDNATILIAEADHLANGQLVLNEKDPFPQAGSSAGPSHSNGHTAEKWNVMLNVHLSAVQIRHFLDTSWSQFTYHGLFTLSAVLEPGSLVALFRSSHLSVLYKSTTDVDPSGPALYNLITDQAFLREPSVIWERLDDVDFGSCELVDSDFIKSSPAGGDFAGQTAEDTLRVAQLQQEEDELARRRQEAIEAQREREIREREDRIKTRKLKLKKPDCVIM